MSDQVVNKSIRSVGDCREFTLDHIGPSSYVQVGNAGSDRLHVGPGLDKGTLGCIGGMSYSGTYYAFAMVPANAGDLPKLSNVEIKWIVVATGAEVAAMVDLDAEKVRFQVQTL